MTNPGVFEFSQSWPALYVGGLLLLSFAVALVSALFSDSYRVGKIFTKVAYASFSVTVASILAIVSFCFAANAEASAHEKVVSKWLVSEYDVHVADGDLGALLDNETVSANVNGEKRFVALADGEDDDLVLLTAAGGD